MDNYICIGDIHGRFDLLEILLTKIEARSDMAPQHKFVFLGDYVDRGPDSFKVVDRIKSLVEDGRAIALRGNHEDMMVKFYDGKIPDKRDIWIYNGGDKTINSYAKTMEMYGIASFFMAFGQSGHAAFIKSLPFYYETEKVFFSHAPVPLREYRQKEDFRKDTDALIWSWHGHFGVSESEFVHDHGKLAACGHVHALRENVLTPRIYEKIIYTDTGSGCAPWGPLTAVIITDGKFKEYVQAIPK